MERKLRIAQYGCGKMSVYTMRYAMENAAEIVSAFGRSPHNLGKDIGDIAGVGKTGILVQDSKDAAAILKEKKPDACIITTASLMQDLKGPFMDCAESGVSAITIGDEAFYPWNSSYQTTQLLDDLAKKNGCTLCGSGYQDVLWGNLITTLAGVLTPSGRSPEDLATTLRHRRHRPLDALRSEQVGAGSGRRARVVVSGVSRAGVQSRRTATERCLCDFQLCTSDRADRSRSTRAGAVRRQPRGKTRHHRRPRYRCVSPPDRTGQGKTAVQRLQRTRPSHRGPAGDAHFGRAGEDPHRDGSDPSAPQRHASRAQAMRVWKLTPAGARRFPSNRHWPTCWTTGAA